MSVRVLHVMNDHPFTGHSGISVYTRDLQPALRDRGLAVATFHIGGRDWRLRPYLRASAAHDTTLFAAINAPMRADDSLLHPKQDLSNAAIERLLGAAIDRFRPDVVHAHTFYGLPFSTLRVARQRGVRTVLQLHDFWQICSRLLLPRPGNVACEGPDGGRNCVRFCARPLTRRERLYRVVHWLPDGVARRAFFALRGVSRRVQGRTTTQYAAPAAGYGVNDPALLAAHGDRVRAGLAAFDDADRVLAVSAFVRDVFARHGIARDRITVFPTSLKLNGVTWKRRAAADGPVRFGYLGRVTPTKGAHVFAAAAGKLPPGAGRFLLFGPVDEGDKSHLESLAGPGRLEFRGAYARADLGRVFDELDVVVIPTLAQETTGLVNVEAQAAGMPILASRAGAVPEYVRDGETGYLFEPGNADDLAGRMRAIADDPGLVAAISGRTKPAAPLESHVHALVEIYHDLLRKGGKVHA